MLQLVASRYLPSPLLRIHDTRETQLRGSAVLFSTSLAGQHDTTRHRNAVLVARLVPRFPHSQRTDEPKRSVSAFK